MAAPTTAATARKYQPKTTTKYQTFPIRRCFKIYAGKDLCWSLFLIQVQSSTCSFTNKKTPVQVFSCEIIKNTFFIEHLLTTASGRAQDFTKNGLNSNSYWYFQSLLSKRFRFFFTFLIFIFYFIFTFLRFMRTVDSWSFSQKLIANVFLVLEFSLPLELHQMLSLAFHLAN